MSTNYENAISNARDASMWGQVEDPNIAAMNGQTYALLALADAIEGNKPEPTENTHFVIANSTRDAIFRFQQGDFYFTRDETEASFLTLGQPVDQAIYRINVEVIQE